MFDFDEISIRNEFISHIREIFAKEYDLIGEEVSVVEDENQEATFPCCVVKVLNPISDERYADSDGTYKFINFSLSCDVYSKILDGFSLEDSVIKLKQILIKGFLQKYSNFAVTRDNAVPYRTDTKRRNVTFRCTYDNINKIIYSN